MPFTDSPWSTPESDLEAGAFCRVCLIDENEGREKVKGKCHLPIRKRPGAPINRNAVHAAAGGHGVSRVKASAGAKKKAARRIVSLYREMGEVAPEHVYRIAGMKRPAEKKG